MKMTIQERAKNYDETVGMCHNEECSLIKEIYIDAASEQQAIDIERAWRIFQKYTSDECAITREQFASQMKGE